MRVKKVDRPLAWARRACPPRRAALARRAIVPHQTLKTKVIYEFYNLNCHAELVVAECVVAIKAAEVDHARIEVVDDGAKRYYKITKVE